LLQEINALPSDYCPEVLSFIESLKANRRPEVENDLLDLPILVEKDPFFTAEHLEHLKQREKAMIEGKSQVIPFTDEEWQSFGKKWNTRRKKPKSKQEAGHKGSYIATVL
jgi:hypothetical protein